MELRKDTPLAKCHPKADVWVNELQARLQPFLASKLYTQPNTPILSLVQKLLRFMISVSQTLYCLWWFYNYELL